ncbi:MAG: hypothetical protein IT380_08335 [Myxococcales bacterium]|nr:hypothetical protein [Myxococcales bacterium]
MGASWDPTAVQPPWGARASLYEHIQRHLQPGGHGLAAGGERLPDEAPEPDDGGLRWAPGAMDGVLGHHVGEGDQAKAVDDVVTALSRAVRAADPASLEALYAALKANSTIEIVDSILARIEGDRDLQPDRIHALARWLATRAADREPVKAGMALLGLIGQAADEDVLLTLGRHEEFTLFAAVAVTNSSSQPDRLLWRLAKGVDGWGRIQTVERLAQTSDPEIKAWLLREGYRNSVMYEYLAYTCAVAGDLKSELARPEVDGALFDGASELLATLIDGQGGPAEGIDDYESAPAALESYLCHAQRYAQSLKHFLALKSIERFLAGDDGWDERQEAGWSPEVRQRLLKQAVVIASRPGWSAKTSEALKSTDRAELWTATQSARALGIDTWDEYFARVSAGEDYWFQLVETTDQDRIGRALELALKLLPLEQIATGPANQLGLGPGFTAHGHLDSVLQALTRFPRQGWPFLRAGMKSPVTRNRNLAIRALGAWPRADWPEEAEAYVRGCAAAEPDEKVRAWFERLLAGQPLNP